MEREKLVILDEALNKLEFAVVHLTNHEDNPENMDVMAIQTHLLQAINELDKIVPRPLPPDPNELQDQLNKLRDKYSELEKRLERAERVTDMHQKIGGGNDLRS